MQCAHFVEEKYIKEKIEHHFLIKLDKGGKLFFDPLIIQTNKKVVYQYDKKTGELLNTFDGVREAGRQTGIDYTGILKNCNGKYKSSGGFIWSYEKR